MTSDQLSTVAAVILSLIFSYVPQAKTWFDQFSAEQKRLLMLAMVVLTAVAMLGLSCAGQGDYFVCSEAGFWDVLRVIGLAAVANQIAYKYSPALPKTDSRPAVA